MVFCLSKRYGTPLTVHCLGMTWGRTSLCDSVINYIHRRVQRGGQGVLTPPFPGPPLFICEPPFQPNPISQTNVM